VLDMIRIYVLWHPQSETCGRYAEAIAKHFDGLGMEREGVQYRIPIRFRSEAWDTGSGPPRSLTLGEAQHNAIVFLHSGLTRQDHAVWNPYLNSILTAMAARGGADCIIPFRMNPEIGDLSALTNRNINSARMGSWATTLPDPEARWRRGILHILHTLRVHLRTLDGVTAREHLFVSHAKLDGDGTARAIVAHINDVTQDVPLHAFYDAKELMPGEQFEERFEREISEGTLLALVSDLYDTRPWCIWELTTAKRARRPIVLADVGHVRVSRTYPYGANLPRIRLGSEPGAPAIEALLVEAMSEGLRCDLFVREAKALLQALGKDGLALPRPPELFDLVDTLTLPETLVYPEPPVGKTEQEILDKAIRRRGGTRLYTLGELA
jgi:hypothetical protein